MFHHILSNFFFAVSCVVTMVSVHRFRENCCPNPQIDDCVLCVMGTSEAPLCGYAAGQKVTWDAGQHLCLHYFYYPVIPSFTNLLTNIKFYLIISSKIFYLCKWICFYVSLSEVIAFWNFHLNNMEESVLLQGKIHKLQQLFGQNWLHSNVAGYQSGG